MTTGTERSIERQKRNIERLAKLYADIPWAWPESRQVRRARERHGRKADMRLGRRERAADELKAFRARRKAK